MRQPCRFVVCSISLLAIAAACGTESDDVGDDTVDDAPTYYQDVKPIIDAKCGGCHTAGGIGPFELATFEQVSDNAAAAQLNIQAGLMPPWPPNPDCNEYYADRSLTDEQKAVFDAWVEAGKLEGDPADEAPPLEVEDSGLSRVDLTIEMPTSYTPQTTPTQPDDYRCFVIPFPASIDTTRYVTGFRAVPGNGSIVHHVIAFYAPPDAVAAFMQMDADEPGDGYTCFAGPGGDFNAGQFAVLSGWAPGSLGTDFPAGTGLAIEPGSAVILQVHYNVVEAGPQPDRTAIELKIDDTVDKVARIQPWANPQWLQGTNMHIPAGDDDVMHAFEFDATVTTGGQPFTIYTATSHQHQLGSRSTSSVVHSGGGTSCLLQIDDWDFHWQGSYGLRNPVRFEQGDRLRMECHWDNSAQNQPMINGEQMPPRDVYWGEGSYDEMCLAYFYITVDEP